MSAHTPDEIKKHVKFYISVFAALACLTVVTVGISYLHLSIVPAVVLALIVASLKGGLVMAFFMHLLSEKRIILYILSLTFFFFLVLLILPVLA